MDLAVLLILLMFLYSFVYKIFFYKNSKLWRKDRYAVREKKKDNLIFIVARIK